MGDRRSSQDRYVAGSNLSARAESGDKDMRAISFYPSDRGSIGRFQISPFGGGIPSFLADLEASGLGAEAAKLGSFYKHETIGGKKRLVVPKDQQENYKKAYLNILDGKNGERFTKEYMNHIKSKHYDPSQAFIKNRSVRHRGSDGKTHTYDMTDIDSSNPAIQDAVFRVMLNAGGGPNSSGRGLLIRAAYNARKASKLKGPFKNSDEKDAWNREFLKQIGDLSVSESATGKRRKAYDAFVNGNKQQNTRGAMQQFNDYVALGKDRDKYKFGFQSVELPDGTVEQIAPGEINWEELRRNTSGDTDMGNKETTSIPTEDRSPAMIADSFLSALQGEYLPPKLQSKESDANAPSLAGSELPTDTNFTDNTALLQNELDTMTAPIPTEPKQIDAGELAALAELQSAANTAATEADIMAESRVARWGGQAGNNVDKINRQIASSPAMGLLNSMEARRQNELAREAKLQEARDKIESQRKYRDMKRQIALAKLTQDRETAKLKEAARDRRQEVSDYSKLYNMIGNAQYKKDLYGLGTQKLDPVKMDLLRAYQAIHKK